MNLWALITIALPAAGGAITFAGGRDRRHAEFWSVAPVAAALLTAILVQSEHGEGAPSVGVFKLAAAGQYTIWLGTRVTGLSALVAILVAVVALAVQVYSLTYMQHDRRYASYAALISIFTAAMLLVVYSDDLIVLLVGWEVMGACSYFLIGHYWDRQDARSAAIKAFLVTKAGDVPFLIGIAVLGVQAGGFRVDQVLAYVASGRLQYPELIATLLLCGAVGKSAQFPLHSWLPDAMAGPTPISALIHAATMVAAGVYLIALLYPVFVAAPGVLILMSVIAAVTMVGSALAALAQTDVKRVLAYSTVSQLAYMFGALASGGRTAAVFHLLTHGVFKALLFLGAGVVIHRIGTNEISEMGGLRYRMPVTFWTMTVGLGSLAGFPLLSGFFSKEGVLGAAWDSRGEFAAPGWIVLVAGLATVLLTAAYAGRLWLKMFFGPFPPASPDDSLVEAPQQELVPLLVLAVPAALLGFVALAPGAFGSWIGGEYGEPLSSALSEDLRPAGFTTVLALLLAALGFLAVWLPWRADPQADPAAILGPLRVPALNGFYFDRLQDRLLVRPTRAAARAVGFADTEVVDAYVRGSGVATRSLGGLLRRLQTGNVQFYLTALFSVMIVVAAVFAREVS